MSHQLRLAPAAATLGAGLLLVAGALVTDNSAAPHPADPNVSTPCLVSADRVDQYRQAHLQRPGCTPARQATQAVAGPSPCLVVADRVEQWNALGLELPTCIRRLQRG